MGAVAGAGVVVGIDGSERSLDAVRVAAAEAVGRGRTLRIVHAFVWPSLGVAVGPAADAPTGTGADAPTGTAADAPTGIGLRFNAERIVAEAAALAQKTADDLPAGTAGPGRAGLTIETAIIDGAAVPVLLRESRGAALLVIGDRGLGGFSGLIIGSVAVQAAAHAACPVLVVRGEQHSTGPVVVGVDGSETSALAVGFAVEEAARRGTALVAVHAWNHPVSTGPGDMLPLVYDVAGLESEERRVLSESLVGWSDRYPEVIVRPELVRGRAGHELVERSKGAQLVVVGARGRGGFAGLLLGSVSQTVLYHAACPVAVVRASLAVA